MTSLWRPHGIHPVLVTCKTTITRHSASVPGRYARFHSPRGMFTFYLLATRIYCRLECVVSNSEILHSTTHPHTVSNHNVRSMLSYDQLFNIYNANEFCLRCVDKISDDDDRHLFPHPFKNGSKPFVKLMTHFTDKPFLLAVQVTSLRLILGCQCLLSPCPHHHHHPSPRVSPVCPQD